MWRQRQLTNVVVIFSHEELVAEGEGTVALELLRELDGRVWRVRPVALPALEAQLWVTVAVAEVSDHVEHILLAGAAPLAVVVVWAVDVQVVVDIHLHRVALSTETGGETGVRDEIGWAVSPQDAAGGAQSHTCATKLDNEPRENDGLKRRKRQTNVFMEW